MFIISKPSSLCRIPLSRLSSTLMCVDLNSHISRRVALRPAAYILSAQYILLRLTSDQRYLIRLIYPRWRANANHVSRGQIECDKMINDRAMLARTPTESVGARFVYRFFLVYI